MSNTHRVTNKTTMSERTRRPDKMAKNDKGQRAITILNLPDDILIEIFRLLPAQDLHHDCLHVCKRFKSILDTYFHSFDSMELNLCGHQCPTFFSKATKYLTTSKPLITELTINGVNYWNARLLPDIFDQVATILKSLTLQGSVFDLRPNDGEAPFEDLEEISSPIRTCVLKLRHLHKLDLADLGDARWSHDYFYHRIVRNLEELRLSRLSASDLCMILCRCSLASTMKVLEVKSRARDDHDDDNLGWHEWSPLASFTNLTSLTATGLTKTFWRSLLYLTSLRRLQLVDFSLADLNTFNAFSDQFSPLELTLPSLERLDVTTSEDISRLFSGRVLMWEFFPRIDTFTLRSCRRRTTRASVITSVHNKIVSLYSNLEALFYCFPVPRMEPEIYVNDEFHRTNDTNGDEWPKKIRLIKVLMYGPHDAIHRELSDLKQHRDFSEIEWTYCQHPKEQDPSFVGSSVKLDMNDLYYE